MRSVDYVVTVTQFEPNFHREGRGAYRLLRAVLDGAVRRLEAGLDDPRAAQEARFRALLRGAAGTAFGQEHGLDRANSQR